MTQKRGRGDRGSGKGASPRLAAEKRSAAAAKGWETRREKAAQAQKEARKLLSELNRWVKKDLQRKQEAREFKRRSEAAKRGAETRKRNAEIAKPAKAKREKRAVAEPVRAGEKPVKIRSSREWETLYPWDWIDADWEIYHAGGEYEYTAK